MRPKDRTRAKRLERDLRKHERANGPLLGIRAPENRDALIEQLVESIRRIEYIAYLQRKPLSPLRADPNSELFDPLMAAVLKRDAGDHDEACWLVFLSVHFGKHGRDGWRLTRDVYGRNGQRGLWDWTRTSNGTAQFNAWLTTNYDDLQGADGVRRRFGNHRKYETLNPRSARSTGNVVSTYAEWVRPYATHAELFHHHHALAHGDGKKAFDLLYRSLDSVMSFGRTAKFDYLTMLGKLRLADISPGSAYLAGATGPLRGAKLLFGGSTTAKLGAEALDRELVTLDKTLGVGMQVLEDSLCNWQKNPGKFVRFRG